MKDPLGLDRGALDAWRSAYPPYYDVTQWECEACDARGERATDADVPWWGNPLRIVPCANCNGEGICHA